MKLENLASSLKRLLAAAIVPDETDLFLRSRNARVTVQDADQRSFHVIKMTPRTDIAAFGRNLQIRVKYNSNRTATLVVYDKESRQVLVNLTAPITHEGGTTHLNFADIRLKIDIDAGPMPGEKSR